MTAKANNVVSSSQNHVQTGISQRWWEGMLWNVVQIFMKEKNIIFFISGLLLSGFPLFPLSGPSFLCSKQGVLVCSCLFDRRLKANFGYSKSEHMEPVVEALSARLRLTAGSPSSITVVGRDWFLWGRQSHGGLNVLLWLVRFDLCKMYGCLTFCLFDALFFHKERRVGYK